MKVMGAGFVSFWLANKIDFYLYHYFNFKTPITAYVVPLIMVSLFFCAKWIVKKIIIPVVLLSMTGIIPVIVLTLIGKYYKTDFLYNSYLVLSVAIGIPLLLVFLLILGKFSNHFNSKSLEEIDKLGNGDPKKGGFLFEEYVASLYNKLGYSAQTVGELKKQGKFKTKGFDQGADVVIEFTENGVKKRGIIQCKLYSDKVSNKAIQEVVGALPIYKADFGIVLTNNFFTAAAIELAEANNILLVDRNQLGALIEKVNNPKIHTMIQRNQSAA